MMAGIIVIFIYICILVNPNTGVIFIGQKSEYVPPRNPEKNIDLFGNELEDIPYNISHASPVMVNMSLYIRSIWSIDPESMDYVTDLYLHQHWFDYRAAKLGLAKAIDLNDRKQMQDIWRPDIIFPNAKEAMFHYVTIPNVFMRIQPNGNILYILRMKLTLDCMMSFWKYPLDTQKCTIEMSSFANTNDILGLEWTQPDPITFYSQLTMAQFTIETSKPLYCNNTYYFGQYSCVKAELHLKRQLSYHLVQPYFSTTLVVVISWLSFWLPIHAIAARTTLGVTTLLTISSKGVGIENNLPPVTYLKAIDVWIFTCTTFVFAALLEFTIANYMERLECECRVHHVHDHHHKIGNKHRLFECLKQCHGLDCFGLPLLSSHLHRDRPLGKLPERIDHTSRYIFPLAFILFNAIYWMYYLHFN